MEQQSQTPPQTNQNYGYGKRPLWQWILIYIVVGGLIYGLVYYFFLNKNGGYNTNSQYLTANPQAQDKNNNTNQPSSNYMTQNMKVETLKEGSGQAAKTGDTVTVNYTGTLTDGTKFDSSRNPGRTPFPFTLGQHSVIQGWELGVLGMKIGEKRRLTIPPELAYGAAGRPPVIPANATLIFEIDLLAINPSN